MAHAQIDEDMDADDLTKTERAVLDVLKRDRETSEPWGIATKGRLVDESGFSRNSVYNALKSLKNAECIEEIHEPTREFKFLHDPREDDDA